MHSVQAGYGYVYNMLICTMCSNTDCCAGSGVDFVGYIC